MAFMQTAFILVSVTLAFGQRPFFAGSKPIGYPVLDKSTTTKSLENRFGESDVTTQRLPIEALGDRDLVDRLSKLPIDKQPFWLLNWQALEEQRKKPQTYPQRPSPFAESTFNSNSEAVNSNSAAGNSNSATVNSNSAAVNSNSATVNSNSATVNSNSASVNSGLGSTSFSSALGNRNGDVSDENKHASNENASPGLSNSSDKVLSDPHLNSGNVNSEKINSGVKNGYKVKGDSRFQKMYERVY